MTIGTGELGVLGIDVEEGVPLHIDLVEFSPLPLRKNQVTGGAVARLNRGFVIRRLVESIMTTETP